MRQRAGAIAAYDRTLTRNQWSNEFFEREFWANKSIESIAVAPTIDCILDIMQMGLQMGVHAGQKVGIND